MILIDALYINKSGGKVLLKYFISSIIQKNLISNYYFLFDDRLEISEFSNSEKLNYYVLSSSIIERLKFYLNNIDKYDSVFCFANVPPPIFLRKKSVYILFHNTLILKYSQHKLDIKSTILNFLKKQYIRIFNLTSYKWIVQTKSVEELLNFEFSINKNRISVLPFFDFSNFTIKSDVCIFRNRYNYIYVADFAPNKNHYYLLDEWEVFSKSYSREVVLHLTLPNTTSNNLINRIKYLNSVGVKIINHEFCSHNEMAKLYKQCEFLIFPSLSESFGLPLVEASFLGCKVISSDLPFVYDIIQPSLIFNPYEKGSLVRALLLSQKSEMINDTQILVQDKINELIKVIQNV